MACSSRRDECYPFLTSGIHPYQFPDLPSMDRAHLRVVNTKIHHHLGQVAISYERCPHRALPVE